MLVFPLRWLPYILFLGGIVIAIEDGKPDALVLTVIGGVWLYFKYKKKSSGTVSSISKPAVINNTENSVHEAVENELSTPQTQPLVKAEPVEKFCLHCGAKVEPDDIYCVECGEKL